MSDEDRWYDIDETEEAPLRPLWHRVVAGIIAVVLIAALLFYTAMSF